MAERTSRGGRRTGWRAWSRRLVRGIAIAGLLLAALPIVLVPLYAVVPPPASTLEVWQRLNGVPIKKRWVPLDDIAPVLVHSVIMSEDGQFCAHRGVDWKAVREVLDRGDTRGASTIPMQTVKNLFLWSSRSYVRKGLEVPLAYWADLVWSKRRMIEIYLNIVEWGPGVFGAEAAAQHWFGVPAARLSRRQAALMAAALPNPIARNPAKPGRTTTYLAGIIERRARQAGAYVTCLE
ncbi:monofunctional biosynthetic peptidoglycan transglycosylase [Tepidamorphus gemmatus]|jgi:monofunctional biosynthetic peptidoglycan transglycosylase|uniref:Biosynthetic peptidoglycan transglycosylase n=1 Tax=Tepidamorphus gemmatus TaxID=747076 RepID=A0A4R3MEF1_9HYPH|nr:monofunctional biosynthetic peptidoglycan transglycosylase [Tepidamorphus gemmatus]TCT11871.1 monofunctional biosynthetic peptidoglycan transglycosylase [Tepidamorphus gemmatus]